MRRPNLELALPPATPDLKNVCVSVICGTQQKIKKRRKEKQKFSGAKVRLFIGPPVAGSLQRGRELPDFVRLNSQADTERQQRQATLPFDRRSIGAKERKRN